MINNNYKVSDSSIYKNSNPFPHCVIKDLWDDDFLSDILNEFNNFKNWEGIVTTYGAQAKKFCYSPEKLPSKVLKFLNYLNSKDFISIIENITGRKKLNSRQ